MIATRGWTRNCAVSIRVCDVSTEHSNDVLTVTDINIEQNKTKGTGRDEVQDGRVIRIPAESGSVGDVAPQTYRLDRLGKCKLNVVDGRQGQLPGIRRRDRISARTDQNQVVNPSARQAGRNKNKQGGFPGIREDGSEPKQVNNW